MQEEYLAAKDLAAGYENTKILENVNFSVAPGEILTLIGPNGAGKSTLLRTLAGILKPVGGLLFLDGKKMEEMGRSEIAKCRAAVFTERVRTENLTCREVVAMGRFPHTGAFGKLSDADLEVVDRSMHLVSVEELAGRDYNKISDGQRQRVLLARAMAQEPRIVLLDEPTSFLDIRYQLEFLESLRAMAKEQGMSVVMSMHELEFAKRISDRILCIKNGKVDRIGTPQEIFCAGYLASLFDVGKNTALAAAYVTALERMDAAGDGDEFRGAGTRDTFGETSDGAANGTDAVGFRLVGQKKLRMGVTTGTCAAAAASVAAMGLLEGICASQMTVHTPKGVDVSLSVETVLQSEGAWECFVKKDSGDDPDVTNGCEVHVRVEFLEVQEPKEAWFSDAEFPGIFLDGGSGIGRVTKPGLEQTQGQAALNRVPRQMIFEAVGAVQKRADSGRNLLVTVSVPNGEALAKKTFNPMLGIEGGISILGTSGILEPMSEKAIVDTIETQIRQKAQMGEKKLLVTPGNYGQSYVEEYLGIPVADSIKCSNYIGETIDFCVAYGFTEMLLVGDIGKLVKLAAGIMNTHSKMADGRGEIMAVHAVRAGATKEQMEKILDAVTTTQMLHLLEEWGLRKAVMESICESIDRHVSRRAGEGCKVTVMIFSQEFGYLAESNLARSFRA